MTGFTEHLVVRVAIIPPMHSKQRRQWTISGSRPALAFLGISGSASSPRAIATTSARPEAMISSICAGSEMPPMVVTGMLHRLLDRLRQVHVAPVRQEHRRVHDGHGVHEVVGPAGDVQQVDLVLDKPGERHRVVDGVAALGQLRPAHAQLDGEVAPHALPNRVDAP